MPTGIRDCYRRNGSTRVASAAILALVFVLALRGQDIPQLSQGIEEDPATTTGVLPSAHVYVANRIEFLNEGAVASLHDASANAIARLTGFYSQLGYRIAPNWGGVRSDWNDHVAVKLELGHEADWGAPHYAQAAMQVAFAF